MIHYKYVVSLSALHAFLKGIEVRGSLQTLIGYTDIWIFLHEFRHNLFDHGYIIRLIFVSKKGDCHNFLAIQGIFIHHSVLTAAAACEGRYRKGKKQEQCRDFS